MTTREQIEEAVIAVEEAERHLADLIRACKHTVSPYRENHGAYCLTCSTSFGWSCPSSPDSTCHYFSSDGFVELIDGTLVPVEEGHNAEYETDDNCLFCHDPDERK